MSSTEALPTEIELDALIGAKSLYEFLQLAWHVIEPSTAFVPGRHIEMLCEHLEAVTAGQIRNLLIEVPPGSSKSISTCVMWPAWEWIAKPSSRWLFASYSLGLAERDSEKCGDLIRSPWYQRRWGNCYRLTTDAKTKIQNDRTGIRECFSVGSRVTGAHGDRLVVDDAHNIREAESQAIREATIHWHDHAWYNRVNDAMTSARVVIGQRVHHKDLLGHLEEKGGYEILRLPEEHDAAWSRVWPGARFQDWRSQDGELLREARFGPAQVEEAKHRLGSRGYAAQHQQRPTPQDGDLIKRAWFRYYAEIGDAYRLEDSQELIPVGQCWTFCVVDPAASTNPGADYTAIGTFSVAPGGQLLVRDMVRERLGLENVVPRLNEVCRRYRPVWVAIEKDGIGQGVIQEAGASINQGGYYRRKFADIPSMHELKCEGRDKRTRAMPAVIRLDNRQVYFPRPGPRYPWVEAMEEELIRFTGINDDHDDQADVVAWAVQALDRFGYLQDPGEPLTFGQRPRQPW